MIENSFSRRDFIKLSALGLAVAAGTRAITEVKASDSAKGERQWAMVIDQSNVPATSAAWPAVPTTTSTPTYNWNKVLDAGKIDEKMVYLARPCMHCEHAPCVEVCPVGASYYREDGIVMMDYDKCIGCRYCQVACPDHARVFNWEAYTGENPLVPKWGNPEVERRPRGVPETVSATTALTAAWQSALYPVWIQGYLAVVICPTSARIFGDLNDPNSNVSQMLKNTRPIGCVKVWAQARAFTICP